MLLVTLVALVLAAAVALALVLTGPVAQARRRRDRPRLDRASLVWNIAKWPVMLVVVVLIVALLYYATPNVKQPKFRWLSVGAVLAIVVWMVASALFGFYVANFSSYNKTYGSLAGVDRLPAVAVDHQPGAALRRRAGRRARARPRAAGRAARRGDHPAATPRDTRGIDKAEQKEAEDVARGREIREASGSDQAPRGADPAGQRAVTPSMLSRSRSACPLCRAYSPHRCT